MYMSAVVLASETIIDCLKMYNVLTNETDNR